MFGDVGIAREDIHVPTLDLHASILCNEAAIVASTSGSSFDAIVFGDVNLCAKWNHFTVNSNAQQRSDRFAERAAAPGKLVGVEGFKTDVLRSSGADLGAFTIPFGKTHGSPIDHGSATLDAKRLEEAPRDLFDRRAAPIHQSNLG